MKSKRRRALSIIFLAITAASTIVLARSTLNYMEFYTALKKLTLQLSNFGFSIEPNLVLITVDSTIVNPTSYVGLELVSVSIALYFEADGETVELTRDEFWYTTPKPLNPYLNITLKSSSSVSVNSISTQLFIKALEQGSIDWTLAPHVVLATLIGPLGMSLDAVQFTYPSK
mgnify:CR=1 FL=1